MNIQLCKKCLNCQDIKVDIDYGFLGSTTQLVHIMKPIEDESLMYTCVCFFLCEAEDCYQFDKIPADSYKKCRFYFENLLLQTK